MADDVVSVIPTFRPDPATRVLAENLAKVAPVLIADDASPCTYDHFLKSLTKIEKVQLSRHTHNMGVGRGLNDGLDLAHRTESMWLLTADQDSIITATYFESLMQVAKDLLHEGVPVGAIAAETVLDASGPMTYPTRTTQMGSTFFEETDEVIQSGTLWHVPSLLRHGGFNSRFGMDAVDAEACLGLRELGRIIVIAQGLAFHHRIGRAQQINLMGRSVMITQHRPVRRMAMVRNRLVLFPREFRSSPKHAFVSTRRALLNATLSSLPPGWTGIHPREH